MFSANTIIPNVKTNGNRTLMLEVDSPEINSSGPLDLCEGLGLMTDCVSTTLSQKVEQRFQSATAAACGRLEILVLGG